MGMAGDDSGKRGRPRDSMFLQAVIRSRGSGGDSPAFPVRVRNISAGGLMAQSDRPVARGDHIFIELRNIGQVGGTVAWINEDRFGVEFDAPVDPKLARQKVGGARAVAPQISGAGFRKVTHPLG